MAFCDDPEEPPTSYSESPVRRTSFTEMPRVSFHSDDHERLSDSLCNSSSPQQASFYNRDSTHAMGGAELKLDGTGGYIHLRPSSAQSLSFGKQARLTPPCCVTLLLLGTSG